MCETQRYLLQVESNAVFIWTEIIEKKKGFAEITEAQAKKVIAGGKLSQAEIVPTTASQEVSARITTRDAVDNILNKLADSGSSVNQFFIDMFGISLTNEQIEAVWKKRNKPVVKPVPKPTAMPPVGLENEPVVEPVDMPNAITTETPAVKKAANENAVDMSEEMAPELKKIRGFRNKNQVEEYMLNEYEIEIDRSQTLADLKTEAFSRCEEKLKAKG